MAKNKLKKQTPDLGRSLIRNRFSSRRNAGSDSFIRVSTAYSRGYFSISDASVSKLAKE